MLDELERVRAFGAATPDADDATVRAARAELLARIAAAPPAASAAHRRPRRRSSRRLVLAGGLTVAILVAAGLLGFQTAANPPSALASDLNQLAAVAARQAWTGIPGRGQYLYTESYGVNQSDTMGHDRQCAVNVVDHRQIWIATNGSGAIDERLSDPRFTSGTDRATCAAMGVTARSQAGLSRTSFPAHGLGFPTDDWRAYSTDPRTLLGQIHRHDGGPDTPQELFVNIGDYLRESDAPPAIRATLYRAAALIPDTRLLGLRRVPHGQVGLAVGSYRDGRLWSVLVFDQRTARLLGEESFGSGPGNDSWTAYTRQAIVSSAPDYHTPMTCTAQGMCGPPGSIGSAGTRP